MYNHLLSYAQFGQVDKSGQAQQHDLVSIRFYLTDSNTQLVFCLADCDYFLIAFIFTLNYLIICKSFNMNVLFYVDMKKSDTDTDTMDNQDPDIHPTFS